MTRPIEFRYEDLQEATDFYSYAQEDLLGDVDSLKGRLQNESREAAGADSPGEAFSSKYDESAVVGMEVVCGVVNAAGTMHDLLQQTAFNYATANDKYDRSKMQDDRAVPDWSAPLCFVPNVPSTAGGDGVPAPGWWERLHGHVTEEYPKGREGQLESLMWAWTNAASALENANYQFDRGKEYVTSQNTPDIDPILKQCYNLDEASGGVVENLQQLGQAAERYCVGLESTKKKLDTEIRPVVETAIRLEQMFVVDPMDELAAKTLLQEAGVRADSLITNLRNEVEAIRLDSPDKMFAKAAMIQGLLKASIVPARRDMSEYPKSDDEPSKRRVTLRKDTKEAIKQRMRDMGLVTPNGDFIDPNTGEVIPKDGPFDYGHVPGYEWWRTQVIAREQGWSREELIAYENDPRHYLIEAPSSNRSRTFEQPRE